MYDADDEPIAQNMKRMTVIDVMPGRAKDPETGPPIGILVVEYKHEIEQPMMFNMDDVRRLAIGFMKVWAYHGNEAAEQALLQYFPCEMFDEEFPCPPQPSFSMPTDAIETPQSGLPILTAKFRMRNVKPITFAILAGYQFCGERMLLVQSKDFDDMQLLVKIGRCSAIYLKGHSQDESLPKREWWSLRKAKAGSAVHIGNRYWSKMTDDTIQSLVNGKIFWVTSPK